MVGMSMIWFFYNLLFAVVYTLMLPRFLWRMRRRGGYSKGFLQRFGIYAPEIRKRLAQPGRIWIHAVSVGEVYVALRFVEALRESDPGIGFVLTTTTSTGHRIAEAHLHRADVLLYFPVDFPPVVRRVLNTLQPRMLLLTENELWPNLLRAAKRRGIPVILINGRISESSFRGYRLLSWITRPALRMVDLFLVQSELDRSRLLQVGAEDSRIEVMGSAKYDVVRDDPESEDRARAILGMAGMSIDDLLLVAGSTWPGEERVLLQIYRELRVTCPRLKLLLVPRHMERRSEVEDEIVRQGLPHLRRSDLADRPAGDVGADILLVDSTGELTSLYTVASVIFVGKSLMSTGGQNVIEPALPGKAIVVGPHLENFPDVAADFLKADALIQVQDAEELSSAIGRLVENEQLRTDYGRRARALVESRRGVVNASVERILAVTGDLCPVS